MFNSMSLFKQVGGKKVKKLINKPLEDKKLMHKSAYVNFCLLRSLSVQLEEPLQSLSGKYENVVKRWTSCRQFNRFYDFAFS